MILSFFILTASQLADARALNDDDAGFGGRSIDNANAGSGANLNPDADGYGFNDPVDLRTPAKWVVNATMLNNPECARWHAMLAALPLAQLDTDLIFAPAVDD